MSVAMIEDEKTLSFINSQDSKPIAEWKRLYPTSCLFIEVTREDEWEVYEGKLIAIAEDSIEFVELAKAYEEQGLVCLVGWGDGVSPGVAWVA